MIIIGEHIRKELKQIWRDLQFVWPTNPNWTPMLDEMLPRVIEHCSVRHMVNIPHIWECENYTYRWMTNVEVFFYELHESGEYRPECRSPVGACMGFSSDIFGNAGTHAMNLIRLESGWVLFEPQTDTVSKDFYSYIPFHIKF